MITGKSKKTASISKGIPQNLSALSFAYRLTQRAARLGFDWPDLGGVLKKMDEELREFREALARPPRPLGGAAKSRPLRAATRKRVAEELGDLLFVLVNVARFLGIDPEAVLKGTIRKFNSRFSFVETSLRQHGKSLRQSNLHEMDLLWEEAKRRRKVELKAKVKKARLGRQ